MSKIKIITDTCADLGNELAECDMDFVRMTATIDGKTFYVSPEHGSCAPEMLYAAMRDGKTVTLGAPSFTEYMQAFAKYVESGFEIVYISCAAAVCDALKTAEIAARRIAEKYVGAKIVCVDSNNMCGGETLVAAKAAKFAQTASSAQEVAEYADSIKDDIACVCACEFDALKASGMISGVTAFLGKLSGAKPIAARNGDGKYTVMCKAKGAETAAAACVDIFKTCLSDEYPVSEQTVFVEHADNIRLAEYVADLIKELAPKAVHITHLGPMLGRKFGAGSIALFGFGKPVADAK